MTQNTHPTSRLAANTGMSFCVVAAPGYLDPVAKPLEVRFGDTFACPLPADHPVPADRIASADVVVVEIDPDVPASLARIGQIQDVRPDIVLIAAVARMDVGGVRMLIRRGVQDVVALPFDTQQLFEAILEAGSARATVEDDIAPLIGIVHASGGIGASTLASHLAPAMAQVEPGHTCCLIDLDLQFGELADLFGHQPVANLLDLIEARDRLDAAILRDAAMPVADGVWLIAAPDFVPSPESIDTDALLSLLRLARSEFEQVIIDLPRDWTSWSLSAACACDRLYLVVGQSIRSLHRAKRTLALLQSVDVPASAVELIINRAERRLFQSIGSDQVRQALDCPVAATLPLQKGGLSEAQEQGRLLSDTEPRSSYVKAVAQLAKDMIEGGDD